MTDDERAIRSFVATWMTATKTGDLATVLSLMTDDVVFMVPGQKPFGKEAFAAANERMKNVQIDGTSEIQDRCLRARPPREIAASPASDR